LLKDIVEKIGDGLHGTPVYYPNTGYYFINGNNLLNGKIVINSSTKEINKETFDINNKDFTTNTLFLSINGTIGNVAKYGNELIMLGKSIAYFNFKNDSLFFYHLFHSKKIQDYFNSQLTGTTIKNLSLKTLREAEFSLPSQKEQTKIANFLSAIDDKINAVSDQIEKTETWKKGLLQKIFV
jgi:type I restriction enzyme S subunit